MIYERLDCPIFPGEFVEFTCRVRYVAAWDGEGFSKRLLIRVHSIVDQADHENEIEFNELPQAEQDRLVEDLERWFEANEMPDSQPDRPFR